MSSLLKKTFLTLACLMLIVSSGAASEFIVDDDGVVETDFADLGTALATIGAYGGTHTIVVREGSYTDEGLTVPGNITSIMADGEAVFTGTLSTHFLNLASAPSGFVIDGFTIDSYTYGIITAGADAVVTNNLFTNNVTGVYFHAIGWGNTATDNCFIGNTTTGLDNNDGGEAWNVWNHNFYDDYTDAYTYTVSGSAASGRVDSDPQTLNMSATGPATAEVFVDEFTVEIMWTVPDCEAARDLAAYEFVVNFNQNRLTCTGAEFDPDFFGESAPAGDAFYVTGPDIGTGTVTFTASNFVTPVTESGVVGTLTFTGDVLWSTDITISSTYLDSNSDPLIVGNTTYSVQIRDDTPPGFTFDGAFTSVTSDPEIPDPDNGDVPTYSDGSTAGAEPKVQLFVTMSATDNFDLDKFEFSWDNTNWYDFQTGLSGLTAEITTPKYRYTGSRPEGANSVYFRVLDARGTASNVHEYPFRMDKTGPDVTIDARDTDDCIPDADFTNSSDIFVDLVDGGDAVKMDVTYTVGGGWGTIVDYANPAPLTIGIVDGAYTAWARLYDRWGNEGAHDDDIITLKTDAPEPAGFTGPAKTKDRTVSLSVSTWGGGHLAVDYIVWEGDPAVPACDDAGWTAITTNPFDYELVGDEGEIILYLATRDAAGNVGPTAKAPLTWTVEYDITPPVITAFNINGGHACSDNASTTTFTVEWDDVTHPDVTHVLVRGSTGGTTWIGLTGAGSETIAFSMLPYWTGTDGDYSLFAILRDNIDNRGPEETDDIYLDGSTPPAFTVDAYDPDYDGVDPTIHANWANDATIDVSLAGVATDVTTVWISDDPAFATYEEYDVTGAVTEPLVLTYTHPNPGECVAGGPNPVHARVMDCSGRFADAGDNIYFDFNGIEVVDFLVTTEDPTDVLLINLSIDGNDNCPAFPWKMNIFEDGFEGDGSGWVTYATTHVGLPLNAAPGDVERTIHLELSDAAGNVATATTTVTVDQEDPTGGTFVLRQPAPTDAQDGYTNNRNCEIVSIVPDDGDIAKMWFGNVETGGSANTGYITLAVDHGAWQIGNSGGWGTCTVNMYLMDNAGNTGGPFPQTIFWEAGLPTAPTAASSTPTGSMDLVWSGATDGHSAVHHYLLKYNFSGDYPTYTVPNPPAPAFSEGFPASGPIMTENEFLEFEGPFPDIYSFSIWAVDMAGNMSASANTDILGTNYILGDFMTFDKSDGPDGCLDFENEFLTLAMAYGSTDPSDDYNAYVDIYPSPDGIPNPDGTIGFYDFIVYAVNYMDFLCSADKGKGPVEIQKPVASTFSVRTEVPEMVTAGEEFTVAIEIDNAQALVGYRVVLDYSNNLELVSAQPGAMYESLERSFFHYDREAANVDFFGIALGATFDGSEAAVLTFRATSDGPVELEEVDLDLRDWNAEQVDAPFEITVVKLEGLIPTEFALSQNYPNPFNPTTTIELSLPVAGNYRLDIYNVIGQKVESFEGYSEAGVVSVEWDAVNYSSGIYLYRLEAGTFSAVKKMVLLK